MSAIHAQKVKNRKRENEKLFSILDFSELNNFDSQFSVLKIIKTHRLRDKQKILPF